MKLRTAGAKWLAGGRRRCYEIEPKSPEADAPKPWGSCAWAVRARPVVVLVGCADVVLEVPGRDADDQ